MGEQDLRISTWPQSKEGGQHAGVSPAVKVEHIPTGLVAICTIHRSQYKNRQTATEMIHWALLSEQLGGLHASDHGI
jgi:protein subunit release factor A